MKIECTQERLSHAIQLVAKISTPKATLPILGNLLLTTKKGGLKISATDLEIGITTWIGAKIDQEGALTVPTRLLSEFISTNSDKNILLEGTENNLKLKSEHFNANIKGIEASEFPIIPEVKSDFTFSVPKTLLSEAISQTVFSTAMDDTRPVLTGVLFKVEKNLVKVVATDSFRLAEKTINLAKPTTEKAEFIIPAHTLQEVVRILPVAELNVEISVSSNQVLFNFGSGTELVTRLVDGEFPDYTQIIPQAKKTSVAVVKKEVASAIKMASYFARESANNIKVVAGVGKGLQIVATSPQLGDNVSQVSAEIVGEEIEISFNAKYLLDALSIIEGEKVCFELNGKFSPAVLKPEKNKDYLYIIMPLRLEE